nr:MAG TPA: hypothetical protein [Caudoviricetes sp.]
MTNQPPLHGPSDRVLRLLLLRENARRQRGLWGLPQEHTCGAAWQAQLSTGILGALVPPCPDGVGVLSFGLDSAMRQRGLRRCTHRLRQATTLRATPLRHAVHPVLVDPSWKLLGYVSAER